MKTTNTIMRVLSVLFISILITSCSPEDGKDGLDGEQGPVGNANVKAFSITVNRADWDQPYHYGENNVYRPYNVMASKLGGTTMAQVFQDGGAVLIYAIPSTVGGYLVLPTTFQNKLIGIKLNAHIRSNDLIISKTTNGWDNVSISANDIPETIEYKIILIPNSVSVNSRLRNIDYSEFSYEEICDMFNIAE